MTVDTFWVLASWSSAHGLYALFASPPELLMVPRYLPYSLAGVPVAMASMWLGSALGLYRPGAPLFGLRVAAAVMCVRAVELAALVGLVIACGSDECPLAILIAYGLLSSTAVLGWRGSLRLLAPYGFDFSRLPRRQRRTQAALQVTVRGGGVRGDQHAEARALPRSRSR